MKLKVIKLHHAAGNETDLVCEDERGGKHTVDLFVAGSLPEDVTPADLIGKTVEVEYLAPYIEIANGFVRICE